MIILAQPKEDLNIQKLYGKECTLSKEDFFKEYHISENGLSEEQAASSLEKYGLNEVSQAKPKKWYNYFFGSLFSPFNSILMGISLVLIYTDIILPETPSYANIIVILVLVIVSTLLDFIEEFRSNKAAEKLKELVATSTTVIRNGKELQIPINQVVLGDIVSLSAGSMIPADLRIIEGKDLYVGQSSLTGESDAVKKNIISEISYDDIESITDLDTICFMGTSVISGVAKGVVIKTADSTYFSKIARNISAKPKTSFQKGIESISKLLIRFMIVLIPIVFLLNFWKHDLIEAFTFAVAIAIGITPLLLPVILSSSLSKGAVRMSKKKTIVKSLDSIQSFGAMNILCTDKTGTLTEDKIVLEKYLDVKGDEDLRVLKHAFLNSYFQTGLRGNIDEAVVKRGLENDMANVTSGYKKVDEIPFDFSRRRLSVIVSNPEQNGEKKQMITKGAVEEILNICSLVDYKGQVYPITKEIKDNIKRISKKMNEDGLRVIAVCQKNDIDNVENFDVSLEKNMVLIGFIGFLDPPKESAKSSIEKLNKAGIRVIVLTGDNAEVTKCICSKVGIKSKNIVLGSDLDKLTDMAVLRILRRTSIFAKLSPIQKARIVRLLKENGNVVGYMGDGINDSPSLSNSDVGISVDTAVDVAKESADIILLEKDLHVLLDGVREGRRTFANLLKYIKMAVSFNFGEVSSVIIASILFPFLPITPIQLLFQSLLYDFGQLTLPFDNVDEEYLKKPRKWDINSLKHFMLFMGPLSSCFDMIVFASMWFIFGIRDAATFQTVWFSYGIVSNLIGMHVIRTAKVPFVQSNANKVVYFSSILLSIIAIVIPYTFLGNMIGLVAIPFKFLSIIIVVPILYCIVALFAKRIYIKKYKEWI
ncbi:MAG: magnesium-translocating P-type ATPase [Clostridium sp. 27_14]|nr:MAG: magnesium-translocating P-type ATPase [Clostridium sp. 27_14]